MTDHGLDAVQRDALCFDWKRTMARGREQSLAVSDPSDPLPKGRVVQSMPDVASQKGHRLIDAAVSLGILEPVDADLGTEYRLTTSYKDWRARQPADFDDVDVAALADALGVDAAIDTTDAPDQSSADNPAPDGDAAALDEGGEAETTGGDDGDGSGLPIDLDTVPEYPASSLSSDDIQAHYDRITPVMDAVASCGDALTIGKNDHYGWYVKRDSRSQAAVSDGFTREGRPATLAKDYGTVRDRLDRVLYAVTSYKDALAMANWEPCRWNDEEGATEWRDEKPMPGYADIQAVSAWGDIDLADALKPRRGDLPDEVQEVVEDALAAYAEEFAKLYGNPDAVFGLDSVGGTYVMGAPAATTPIADHYADDREARGWVFEELVRRSNEWLADAQARVEDRVPGAEAVLDPDWVNNNNRAYKAPLSIHGDHDAVCTPFDTQDPDFELTTVDAVDDDLVSETAAWAADFTATDYRESVAVLVANLWPDEYKQHGDWRAALDAWVDAKREAHAEQAAAAEAQSAVSVDESALTPRIEDVYQAIDDLNIEAVAEQTIVHQWTDESAGKSDTSGDGKRAFIPTWGPNANGTANYIDEKGTWVDTGADDHGTAVEMALIDKENWTRGKIAKGEDWARGVQHLRELGFEIPVWTPDATSVDKNGDEFEKMPYWSLRRAAVALGVADESDFVMAEGEDGGYKRFRDAAMYNAALEAVREAGLEPGREPVESSGGRVEDAPDVPDEPEDAVEAGVKAFIEAEMAARRADSS